MVEYTEFMSICMDECGTGSQDERQAVFAEFASLWSNEKDRIKAMSPSEVRASIECPDV